jgi:hypothetical protein
MATLMATMALGAAAVAGEARTSRAAAAPGAVTADPVPVRGIVEDGTNAVGVQVVPDGTPFEGTYQLRRFEARKGVLYAVGRLDGTMGGVTASRTVALPVEGASNEAPAVMSGSGSSAAAAQIEPTPGACDLLTLDLGPLDLDLLGLRVALDEVHLLLEAIPGAGNLLGNLLCGVAGLLDLGGLNGLLSGLLTAITNLLNSLIGAQTV